MATTAPPAAQQRATDLTIFGATGFTGQFVAAEALRSLPPGTRITIAGRSEAKLQALVTQLDGAAAAGQRLQVLGGVDVSDAASVKRMAEGTRLLVNCVGPFRHWGEPVFAACAAAGTDYLDICGEPEFIEAMQLRYHATAAATGALMASAAGFDSIPADMGALWAARQFAPPAVPSAVEAVIQFSAPLGTQVHYATWEAAVHGMGSVSQLRALRRQAAAAGLNPRPKLVGPKPKVAEGPSWDKRLQAWTLPFPGADAAIVRRTQSALAAAGEPAVHFTARFAAPSTPAMLQFVMFGALMMTLAKWGWGRALLLRYPGLFSKGLVDHEGPTQQQMEATATTFTFFASGYSNTPAAGATAGAPDVQVTGEVSFGDPGYIFTSKMLVQAAATMLQERQVLADTVAAPGGGGGAGGVFTVGTLFRNSSLIDRLAAVGVKFAVKKSNA